VAQINVQLTSNQAYALEQAVNMAVKPNGKPIAKQVIYREALRRYCISLGIHFPDDMPAHGGNRY
jgi:hypothetical protein